MLFYAADFILGSVVTQINVSDIKLASEGIASIPADVTWVVGVEFLGHCFTTERAAHCIFDQLAEHVVNLCRIVAALKSKSDELADFFDGEDALEH